MEFTSKVEENETEEMEMEEVHVDLENAPLDDAGIEEDDYDEDEDPSERIDEGDEDEEGEEEGTLAGGREPSVDMAFVTFQGHTDSVYCSAIHPTIPGVVLTGGGDDRAFVWKYAGNNGEGVIASSSELSGHKDTVTYVGFNFDGTMCFTASYDGTIRVWKFEDIMGANPAPIQVLEGPEDIEWASWHSKGNAVVAGSRDGTAWMWLASTGQCVQVFAGHDGGVSSGGFTKDGKFVYTGGEDGSIRMWLPKTGACKHVYSGATGHESIVTCFASSADGDLLLSGSGDGTVKLYGLGAKKLIRTLIHCIPTAAESGDMKEAVDDDDDREQENESTFSVECVGFDGADKWIASGGMDKCLKIWERSSGACRARCEHGGGVVALQWMGAHPAVCTAALDYIVRVWDARNGSLLLSLTGHNDLITNLSVLPITAAHREQMGRADATDAIVTASDDHTSKIFYVDTLSLLASATGAA